MMIYVCSPYRGELPHTQARRGKNLRKAANHSKEVAKEGHIPITPHLYFSHFLNDADEKDRDLGIKMGSELLALCDEVWVFGEIISEGMRAEIDLAAQLGKPTVYK